MKQVERKHSHKLQPLANICGPLSTCRTKRTESNDTSTQLFIPQPSIKYTTKHQPGADPFSMAGSSSLYQTSQIASRTRTRTRNRPVDTRELTTRRSRVGMNQQSATYHFYHHPSSTIRHLLLLSVISFLFILPLATLQTSVLIQASQDDTATTTAAAAYPSSARELVRRNTATSPIASSNSNNNADVKSNEISQFKLPANYVRLGNNTTLQHPTNIDQHRSSSTNYASSSDNANGINQMGHKKYPEKICIGTSNRMSGQSNKTDQYQNLVERYTNCTHVIGNLEITWLERLPNNKQVDLSFLESIREITGYLLIAYVKADTLRLPNLLLIRGREVFKVNNGKKEEFAMFLMENELTYLELPNLREIIYGHVGFYSNRRLCSVDTINWTEILNTGFFSISAFDKSVPRPKCPDCHSSCQAPSCWGPDEGLCQHFSKTNCPLQCEKGRCYGPGPRDCCHMMCACGCTGPKQTDCFACKNFNNDGECVPECPPMNKYNPSKFLWEPDPNGKHAYGASCVKECPEHLLRDNGACVRSCPPDKRSQNGECVPCAGPCPKNCQGVDVVNSQNIEQLVNCTEIEGSITILDTSFLGYKAVHNYNSIGESYGEMHPSRLSVLGTVRKITGYVNIQAWHPDFKDLSFFSKLETIDGRQTTDMFHSLSIIKTSLKSLNMRSLKRVRSGKILIEENKSLCYAEAAQFSRSNIAKEEDITIRNNGDSKMCRDHGLKCHEQCAPGGCWGPGQNECLSCNNYKLEDYCVKDCTSTRQLNILSFDAGNRTCGKCHQECRGGCNGVSAKNCWHCKNFKDGPYCVTECPKHKYNENGYCQECNKRCVDGCTGPSDSLGRGGCNVCDKFVVDTTNTSIVASCLKTDEPCPRGYYQEYGAEVEEGHPLKALERKPVCKKCHQKCKTCTGYGTHKDVCECAGYMAVDQCEDTCPRDFYPDEKSRRCLRCSRECNGCFGPTEADCLNCRVYRIYYDSTGPIASARVTEKSDPKNSKLQDKFNCTSQCPPEKPHRVSESNLIDPYCSEDPGPDLDNPRIVSIGSTSFLFVLIVSVALMFCVAIYRCQLENSKTVSLTLRLSGFDDVEQLNQSNVEPNLASLRSIKRTELREGRLIGSGFGGSVYQGFWYPEGGDPKHPKPVAIKILKDNGHSNLNKEFLDEAYIMASVNHKNLVKLLAVCMTPDELILVTQLMPLGCLLEYVQKNKYEIGSKNLLEWSKQIANGMAYLEERRMVHRDLALRNVLLQTSNRALISDFGLAKLLDVNQSEYHSGGGRLPIKWLAPECIRERTFTHKSDVWAFGVTIWELLSFGERPFGDDDANEVAAAILAGARLKQPSYVTAEVYKVLYACWFFEPDRRPDFRSLTQDFTNFARDPERYLSWKTDNQIIGFKQDDDERTIECDADSDSLLSRHELISPHNLATESNGFELQHHSDSTTPNGHVTSPTAKKMGMFFTSSTQPLMGSEDMISRSSQQVSSRGSNMTMTDPNNNSTFAMNGNHTHNNNMMQNGWSTVSTNSLARRSEQPTDSDDYLMPSPCSNEEKFTKFHYDGQNSMRVPRRPRQPPSRDPPHSAGLIGISNDAYFITRSNYANSNFTTNASSGHIPSTEV